MRNLIPWMPDIDFISEDHDTSIFEVNPEEIFRPENAFPFMEPGSVCMPHQAVKKNDVNGGFHWVIDDMQSIGTGSLLRDCVLMFRLSSTLLRWSIERRTCRMGRFEDSGRHCPFTSFVPYKHKEPRGSVSRGMNCNDLHSHRLAISIYR